MHSSPPSLLYRFVRPVEEYTLEVILYCIKLPFPVTLFTNVLKQKQCVQLPKNESTANVGIRWE